MNSDAAAYTCREAVPASAWRRHQMLRRRPERRGFSPFHGAAAARLPCGTLRGTPPGRGCPARAVRPGRQANAPVQAARDRHRARGERMGRERDQRVQDGRRFRQRKRHKGRPRPMPWQQGRTSCGMPRHALTPSRSRRQIPDSRSLRRRQRPRHSPGSPAAIAPPGCRNAPRHIAEALCRELLHAHDAGRSRSRLPVRRPGTAPENRAHRPKKYGVSGSQDRADGATLQLRGMREPSGQTAGDLW